MEGAAVRGMNHLAIVTNLQLSVECRFIEGPMSTLQRPLPLVTAAVICYNHARFVVEALESFKADAYPNLQLVVVDDCSRDGSGEIIRQWLERHLPDAVFVEHKTNTGVCRSINEALSYAKGKYVRFLAADDRLVPGTLLRQVEAMEADSEDIGVLYSDAFQMDERGELLPMNFIEAHRPLAHMPEGWIFDTLIEGNFIPGMTALVRRRCLDVVGNADESSSLKIGIFGCGFPGSSSSNISRSPPPVIASSQLR